jgi:hypothetical protein
LQLNGNLKLSGLNGNECAPEDGLLGAAGFSRATGFGFGKCGLFSPFGLALSKPSSSFSASKFSTCSSSGSSGTGSPFFGRIFCILSFGRSRFAGALAIDGFDGAGVFGNVAPTAAAALALGCA